MGTWDIGPFDNDTAADFAGDLDDAPVGEREKLVRRMLKRAADSTDYLNQSDGERAVAAAALIAAQHGGEPTCPIYGPSEPLPTFPAGLAMLAVDALDQVAAEQSELVDGWFDSSAGLRWRQGVKRLRDLLEPPIKPQEDALFEI
ncbi:DUF4259 domain-containing protein [Kitasatospora herbaricolor]|uniref:DUF4259 domain-containing protein n=1 Tax=Kitasatospora herbaricolor TaxID=68217 RepID=A0ABZ1WK90_9ACTN|nr:DUF4259 domain-containing protein [Kitasatospora herbaricolor]